MRDIGLGFRPAPRAGPEGPWPQGPKGPGAECECSESGLRLQVVFGEVMGSFWWQVRDTGLGFGPGGPEGPEGPFQPLGLDVSVPCQD